MLFLFNVQLRNKYDDDDDDFACVLSAKSVSRITLKDVDEFQCNCAMFVYIAYNLVMLLFSLYSATIYGEWKIFNEVFGGEGCVTDKKWLYFTVIQITVLVFLEEFLQLSDKKIAHNSRSCRRILVKFLEGRNVSVTKNIRWFWSWFKAKMCLHHHTRMCQKAIRRSTTVVSW